MEIKKTTTVRFYDYAGVFIGNFENATIGSFRKIINGGLGDLSIELAMGFSEAYESQYTTLFNLIEVVVTDAETPPEGVIIYSGYTVERAPTMKGNEQKVQLICRGHATRFPFLPLKNGSTTILRTDAAAGLTTGGTASAATLDAVFKAIIDRYNAEAAFPLIDYTSTSIAASARTWTYALKTKSIQYAIDKLMENASAGDYWRVGADNIFRFKAKSTTPDHILTLGAQITSIEDRETMDGIANRLHFSYNGSPATQAKVYQDTTSSGKYGDWWDFKVDGRYTVQGEVDNVGGSIVTARKNPQRRTIIRVADSNGSRKIGYNIEAFEPGDTVAIQNLPTAAQQNFPVMFQIMAVDYALDEAVLELDTPDDDLAREVAKAERVREADETENVPATYTT